MTFDLTSEGWPIFHRNELKSTFAVTDEFLSQVCPGDLQVGIRNQHLNGGALTPLDNKLSKADLNLPCLVATSDPFEVDGTTHGVILEMTSGNIVVLPMNHKGAFLFLEITCPPRFWDWSSG